MIKPIINSVKETAEIIVQIADMKAIILNGSPKTNGNTATALHEVECIL